jgi:hypothetical protein
MWNLLPILMKLPDQMLEGEVEEVAEDHQNFESDVRS